MIHPSTTTTTTFSSSPSESLSSTVSHSFSNLSAYISRARPWPTLTSSLSRPESLSDALARLQTNSKHFLINFALIVLASTALFLLVADAFGAMIYAALVAAWLLLHVFREGDVVVNGREVEDWVVKLGLVILSIIVIFWVGMVNTISIGVLVGALICVGIGVCRDTDGLFLDEDDAVTNGLIASGSRPKGSYV